MKASLRWTALGGALLALGSAFVAGRSWADGIPATGALAYSGRLEAPNGEPLTGTHNVEVKFWDAESGGTALCSSNSQSVALDQGRFTVALLDECTDAVQTHPDTYVEILVDGSSLGRLKIGAVPYAVEASHATTADIAGSADTLGTLAPGDVQERVTGDCSGANQSIKTIGANGTVTCETDDNTTYTGNNGVAQNGTNFSADTNYVQRRINAVCSSGQVMRGAGVDGTPTCIASVNTISAGSGLQASTTSGAATVSIAGSGVTRSHLSGTEVQVYQEAEGCGGGLTTNTSCITLPCDHHGSVDLLEFRNCAGTCVNNSVAPSVCTGFTAVGWLLAP